MAFIPTQTSIAIETLTQWAKEDSRPYVVGRQQIDEQSEIIKDCWESRVGTAVGDWEDLTGWVPEDFKVYRAIFACLTNGE